MTVFVPLDVEASLPSFPTFLTDAKDRAEQLSSVVRAILKARRIVVISGAGISVQAGIPDFRSPEGLFQSVKRENPREALVSGKDLFDASVFKAEHTTALFCQMISQLSGLSRTAQPTSFHRLLRSLDDTGKLLRVYTQNIDAIEAKAGLSFGVPEFEDKRAKLHSKSYVEDSRLPTPPSTETPRCIPLHGTLQTVHCHICNHSFPFDDHLASFSAGIPPFCPECTVTDKTRALAGKRTRGVGKLRPSVVLYNETHKDGEGVGDVVSKDLVGSSKGKGRSGADLLLVVGTSLRVPGTKRMVREFAKAVRSRRHSPDTSEDEPAPKAIYMNLDFPVPTREWEGVFDTWIQGDAQEFADIVQAELDKDLIAKDAARERKRKREENINHSPPKTPKKHKPVASTSKSPKARAPPTPHTPSRHALVTMPKSSSSTRRHAVLPPSPEGTPVRNFRNGGVTPKTPLRLHPPKVPSSYQSIDSTPPSPSPSPEPPHARRNTIRIPPLNRALFSPKTPPKLPVRSFFSLAPPTPDSSPPRRIALDLPRSQSKSRRPSPLINIMDVDSDDDPFS